MVWIYREKDPIKKKFEFLKHFPIDWFIAFFGDTINICTFCTLCQLSILLIFFFVLSLMISLWNDALLSFFYNGNIPFNSEKKKDCLSGALLIREN